MNLIIINGKEFMNLKQSKELYIGGIGGLGGSKLKGKNSVRLIKSLHF